MKLKKRSEKSIKGDLLPLMDCMFILLIYFIFSMLDMTNYPGLKVDIPNANTAQKSTEAFNVITIKDSHIYLNKEKVSLDQLEVRLQTLAIEDMTATGKTLHVAAGKEEDTHNVFKVLEKLRIIGEKRVYIETTRK